MDSRQPDMVGDLLLGQRQPIAACRAGHAEGRQPVAQFEEECSQPFLPIGSAEANIPVVQMAFVLRELPGKIYGDGKILGRQVAGFLVMNSTGRGRGERLDGVRLMGHED